MKRAVVGLVLAAAFALPAAAQQVTIRWGDVVGGTHPSVQMIDRIAAEAKEKSGGRIVIQSFPGRPARRLARHDRRGGQRRAADGDRRRRQLRRVGAVDLGRRGAVHLARRRAPRQGDERSDRRRVQRHAGEGARHAHPRHHVLRHAPHHDDEQGSEVARRHGRLQAARARERRVQGDGRGVGREAHADELRRALPRAEAERRRRPGESAADDQVGQVRRGAEVPRAVRPHHHAAARRRSTRRSGRACRRATARSSPTR